MVRPHQEEDILLVDVSAMKMYYKLFVCRSWYFTKSHWLHDKTGATTDSQRAFLIYVNLA